MDPSQVRAAYDAQVRRWPESDGSGGTVVERDDKLVRVVPAGAGRGWSGVSWTDLDSTSVDAAVAAQVARFARVPTPPGGTWEWKHYSYDQPPDLPERLVRAGFEPEPPETLMVAELADLDLGTPPPPGVELVTVRDAVGVDRVVRVHDQVFGVDHSGTGAELLDGLRRGRGGEPAAVVAVVAVAGGTPVAAGRLSLSRGTDFAGLWGGGTLPAWRGRGVFRALIAYRARLAAAAGFRYLQVDASAQSRPILARLGFAELATTTPYTHPLGPG